MKTIVVVDDNADNIALIAEILEDEGYQAVEFEMAESALTYLESHTADLILMDVSLPKMNGLEATKIIKSKPDLHHIPIFMLSAHAMSKDIQAGMDAGADDYITKPIDEEDLLHKIAAILAKGGKSS